MEGLLGYVEQWHEIGKLSLPRFSMSKVSELGEYDVADAGVDLPPFARADIPAKIQGRKKSRPRRRRL